MEWATHFTPILGGLTAICVVASLLFAANRWVPIVLAVFALIPALCVSGYFVLQLLLLLIVAVVCAVRRERWQRFALAAMLLSVGVASYGAYSSSRGIAELQQLRADYPVESLSSRLAYETAATAMPTDPGALDRSAALAEGVRPLRKQMGYRHYPSEGRGAMLALLHNGTYDQFVMAAGFGIWRMQRLQVEVVRLPKAQPIPLACQKLDATLTGNPAVRFAPLPDQDVLHGLHWLGAGNFLDIDRFGWITDRDHVAGFEPHAFTKTPELRTATPSAKSVEDWEVIQLELVSLLKYDTPRVYEADVLPNMQLLSSGNVPTRELDDFETTALAQLRTERDIVIDDPPQPAIVRMLGSLRAIEDCTQCHSVRQGDLLGAFTYRLRPLPIAAHDASEATNVDSTAVIEPAVPSEPAQSQP